ncbi:hypothetical protein CLV35_0044 [Motilibacter peucedani]|uniref:Uncharacterized protein n=1 Tax=Motilibacter peucedani TaxID=598650 RepID=A0A420XVB1_9ACTN|nr:hypothetical protein [Motilibacter peucedani]RKS84228.1 hypothetical protein CLV35_0044 [Motilibacter peucedani]
MRPSTPSSSGSALSALLALVDSPAERAAAAVPSSSPAVTPGPEDAAAATGQPAHHGPRRLGGRPQAPSTGSHSAYSFRRV